MKVRKATVAIIIVVLMGFLALWQLFPPSQEPGYKFVQAWGKQGDGPGEFNEPIGISISGNEVFVSDAGHNRIQVFDLNGNFLRTFGNEGDKLGELARPMHMDLRNKKL